jgi:hypothetical protein
MILNIAMTKLDIQLIRPEVQFLRFLCLFAAIIKIKLVEYRKSSFFNVVIRTATFASKT